MWTIFFIASLHAYKLLIEFETKLYEESKKKPTTTTEIIEEKKTMRKHIALAIREFFRFIPVLALIYHSFLASTPICINMAYFHFVPFNIYLYIMCISWIVYTYAAIQPPTHIHTHTSLAQFDYHFSANEFPWNFSIRITFAFIKHFLIFFSSRWCRLFVHIYCACSININNNNNNTQLMMVAVKVQGDKGVGKRWEVRGSTFTNILCTLTLKYWFQFILLRFDGIKFSTHL